MLRHAFAMKVKDGQMGEFRSNLGKVWGELTAFLDAQGMRNFSIWNVERMIFGYYETGDEFAYDAEMKAKANGWMESYGDCFEWISTPFEEMRLMYHNFGIVRESKELIRHRVFITRLVPGSEEEYKARHDVLVEARGDEVTEGPDSNFSIWNAGGYIFGYNEIDTTMEQERTEADIESDRVWETRMLEIMSWLTDDVDWLTGEHHENIRRLGWHN